MAAVDATFNQLQLQLLDIYQKSMANGLESSLSMETKDGKHFLNFTMGDPTGVTVKTKGNWNPDSRRKKSPSQLKRDEKRRKDFLKNKNETNAKEAPEIKIEAGAPAKHILEEVADEIHLENLNKKIENVFKIKGEFKDPNRKPWLENIKDDDKNEHKAFWKLIEAGKDKLGIDDFNDGSTYVEHFLEFWGDMIFKPGITEDHVKNLENWPKGVGNLQLR